MLKRVQKNDTMAFLAAFCMIVRSERIGMAPGPQSLKEGLRDPKKGLAKQGFQNQITFH